MARLVSSPRLIFLTLSISYIATGIIATLPGASLIRLASNTHVSLEIAGGMFTVSAFGFMSGAILAGILSRHVKPKYLLALGLFLMAAGSLSTALTGSFPVLLFSQGCKGLGFGFIDLSLNTIAALAFHKTLSEKLNNIHGMYGLGALLGPLILALALQFFNSLPLAYLVGVVVSLLTIALIVAQHVPDPPRVARDQSRAKVGSARELRALLGEGLLWLMVVQISLYASAEIGFGNWIVTAVSQSANISLALAAPVATAFFIGLTVGRLGGAQLLKRGWLSETRLLYTALLSGGLCSGLAAIFPAQPVVSYVASALVGCFYGPLFPSLMAITSRRFLHAVGSVGSIMMVGTGASAMLIPATMGLLIPVVGINWVMGIPMLCCLVVIVPMALANHRQRTALPLTVKEYTKQNDTEVKM